MAMTHSMWVLYIIAVPNDNMYWNSFKVRTVQPQRVLPRTWMSTRIVDADSLHTAERPTHSCFYTKTLTISQANKKDQITLNYYVCGNTST